MAKTETIVARRKAAKRAARSKSRSSSEYVQTILGSSEVTETFAELRSLQKQLHQVGSKLDRLLRRG